MSFFFMILAGLCIIIAGFTLEIIAAIASCAFALFAIFFKLDDIHDMLKNEK